jgi:hypothetical protein
MRTGLRFETFSFAFFVAAVVGCAASGAGSGGDAGGGGGSVVMMTAGTSGGTAGSNGTAGSGACTTPPAAHIAWTLATSATGPSISCAQAGATSVTLFMNSSKSAEFSCSAQSGTLGGLSAGAYMPHVLVSNDQGTALAEGNLPAVTVPSCGVADLGAVLFVVSPSGAGGSGGGAAGTSGTAGSTGTGGSSGTGPCNALPIFATHSCAVMACHDANGTSANFDMATSGWENTLVGGTPKKGGTTGFSSACLSAGVPYLVAGSSPARGLFLDKLMKSPPECGSAMPALGPPLTDQEKDCVQRWANGLVSAK